MKNLIRIPMIMALSALCCRAGHAQEFYRGEMFVTGQQFSLADGRLNIDLSVDFEGLRMPSDEVADPDARTHQRGKRASPAGGTHQRQGKAESVPAAKGICRKRASGPHTRSSDKERRQDGALLPIPGGSAL